MLEDTNSLDGAQMKEWIRSIFCNVYLSCYLRCLNMGLGTKTIDLFMDQTSARRTKISIWWEKLWSYTLPSFISFL